MFLWRSGFLQDASDRYRNFSHEEINTREQLEELRIVNEKNQVGSFCFNYIGSSRINYITMI
jgi:hypothetical protein